MRARAREFHALYGEMRIADQLAFYQGRSTQYAAAHQRALILRNILLALAALAGASGELLASSGRAWMGVVAATFGALAVAVTGYEAFMGYEQLGKLYGDAALNLAVAQIDWDVAPEGALPHEMDRVEHVLRAEGGRWGQLVIQQPLPEAARGGQGVEGGTLD